VFHQCFIRGYLSALGISVDTTKQGGQLFQHKMRPSLLRWLTALGALPVILILSTAQGCKTKQSAGHTPDIAPNLLLGHIRMLSSDEFEGRAPGTRGEDLSVAYITEQFRQKGLKPGNPDGTYIQRVPLVGITAMDASIAWQVGGQRTQLAFPTESVVWTKQFVPETKVENSEMVFVGYGVVAPEYGWDDYKGVDVRGKTIVMLINDPAVPDPNDALWPLDLQV
jgi:hypothetical protein